MADHRVGGEVDAWCTRCKMILAHTVVAIEGTRIARVLCNTCKSDHVYRAGPPGEGRPPRERDAISVRPSTVVLTYDEKVSGKDPASARLYNVKDAYKVDEIVRHPAFGIGIVLAVKDPHKIEVMFRTDVKVLVQNKIAGHKPVLPPRPAAEPAPDEAEEETADSVDPPSVE